MSNLKSVSTLLPMVCEMSQWNRNHVHAAFLGREDIPLDDLLEINGIDKVKCPATWHDARPDYTEYVHSPGPGSQVCEGCRGRRRAPRLQGMFKNSNG